MSRLPLLPTAIVGSVPQPEWLIDRHMLAQRAPPRIRIAEIWRVDPRCRCDAWDDATVVAIREQQRTGIDIVGDGEMRRESYSCTFANSLAGIDEARPGTTLDRRGKSSVVPRVVGPIRHEEPVLIQDLQVLRQRHAGVVKITLPGPFTLAQLAADEHYGSPRELALAFADAVRKEIGFLHEAGADVVQIDEPYLEARPEAAFQYGIEAVDRALRGVAGVTALHLCFGYGPIDRGFRKPDRYRFLGELAGTAVDIVSVETAQPRIDLAVLRELASKTLMVGVLDLGSTEIESIQTVRERINAALQHVAPERMIVAPDCGLKYLPRPVAAGKLAAMVAAAAQVRAVIGRAR